MPYLVHLQSPAAFPTWLATSNKSITTSSKLHMDSVSSDPEEHLHVVVVVPEGYDLVLRMTEL